MTGCCVPGSMTIGGRVVEERDRRHVGDRESHDRPAGRENRLHALGVLRLEVGHRRQRDAVDATPRVAAPRTSLFPIQ